MGIFLPTRRQNETSRPSSCWITVVTLGRGEKLQSTEVNSDLCLCLFVDFLCILWTYRALLSLSYCIIVYPEGTRVIQRIWAETRELLALTPVGKNTHTPSDWESVLLPSQSPKWATFPRSTSCSNGSLQRRRDTVINQRAQRHSESAADTQHRSTLIEENYLNVTAEDTLQGGAYLYKLL